MKARIFQELLNSKVVQLTRWYRYGYKCTSYILRDGELYATNDFCNNGHSNLWVRCDEPDLRGEVEFIEYNDNPKDKFIK